MSEIRVPKQGARFANRNAHARPRRFRLGPIACDAHSTGDLLSEIGALLRDPAAQPRTIVCVNAHIVNLAWRNTTLAQDINRARIVAADGVSVMWAARLFGVRLTERCNMTETFRAFMHDVTFPNTRACLIGGTEEVAASAATTINRLCPHTRVVTALSGYHSVEAYRHMLQAAEPLDLVFLGLGTPKSERVAQVVSELWPEAVIWHVGGGTLLFLSGTLPEAPRWMRRAGLQWAHRLMLEPRRLWKRYLMGNPLFLWRVLKQRFGLLRLPEGE